MSSIETSNPTRLGPEYCNIDEALEKELKISFKNMIEVLKKELIPLMKSSNSGNK